VNESLKKSDFSTFVKFGVWFGSGSESGSASKWKSDPDRRQNDADPQQWFQLCIFIWYYIL